MFAVTSNGHDADKVSLYIRVAQSLRARIGDGEWPAGSRLPTFTELASEYEVAIVTIRQAVALLVADGLLSSARGRGTFVSKTIRPIRENASLRAAINSRLDMPDNTSIRILGRETSVSLPRAFDGSPETRYPEYVTVRKLHLLDGEPFALLSVSVASSIYKRLPPGADEKAKIFRLVADQGGLRLWRSRVEMTLAYADQSMAALLSCPALAALVRIQTWRVDASGKLAIATDSYYRGDRFVYTADEYDLDIVDTDPVALPDARTPPSAASARSRRA